MFSVVVNKSKMCLSAHGEKKVVLAEALSCVDSCRDFLMKNMNISKIEAISLIVKSLKMEE